jgi:hypothetical protein
MAVKFINNTELLIRQFRKEAEQATGRKVSYDEVISTLVKRNEVRDAYHCFIEKQLIDSGVPFFNVYPKVLEAVCKTSLRVNPSTIEKSVIHELKAICIKMPVGTFNDGFNSIILCLSESADRVKYSKNGFDDIVGTGWSSSISVIAVGDTGGFIMSSRMDKCFEDVSINHDADLKGEAAIFLRIALGVMMLAADPDMLKPVLLKADEGKTTPIEERIARAKNRGVYGFTIGEEIERCPHFRRPHFAIRWTGKGAEIPKLVPVKGAIVGKKEMTTVPTGFEGEQDEL